MRLLARWIPSVAMLIVLGTSPPSVLAQERYDDEPPPERFVIRIGGFLVDTFDTTFRLDSQQVPIGTVINLEDSLNVDSSENVLRIDGGYNFNKKSRFNFGWFATRRDGITTVKEDIKIGDPDTGEEIVIEAGASLDSRWDFDIFDVTYTWSFVNTWRYELYIGGGLNIRALRIDLEGDFDVNDKTADKEVNVSAPIPLPVGVFGGRYNFSRNWRAELKYQWFRIELGNFKGTLSDTVLRIENATFKNVGFGFGLNSFDLNIEAEGSDFRGSLDSNYGGFLVYVKVYTGKRRK
jgi:hypothetical protein